MYTIHMVRGMRVPVQNGVKWKLDSNVGFGEGVKEEARLVNFDESRASSIQGNTGSRYEKIIQSWGTGPFGYIDEPEVTGRVNHTTH